jgi:hypothetical protein
MKGKYGKSPGSLDLLASDSAPMQAARQGPLAVYDGGTADVFGFVELLAR